MWSGFWSRLLGLYVGLMEEELSEGGILKFIMIGSRYWSKDFASLKSLRSLW